MASVCKELVIVKPAGLDQGVLLQQGAAFLNAVNRASATLKPKSVSVRMATLETIAPSRSRPALTTATSKAFACMDFACVEQDGAARIVGDATSPLAA